MSEPPAKRRRVELSLEDKVKLIKDSESKPKPSLKTLSERYKIGKSTVGDIVKKKEVYIQQWEKNATGNKFRFSYACKFDRLNDLTWEWFSRKRAQNFPLSGPVILEKATEFARELDLQDFKASNGWLESWKSRHSIKAFKVSGESASVDRETVSAYKSRLPDILEGYNLDDVFNADETGLYFKALPDKTLAARGDGAKGIKVHKDRITVMFACSATGEKLKPLIIGKSANPRCMKNVKRDRLGATYVANKKAWMTSAVFTDWIRDINTEMRKQGRKILLFLDNAASHTADLNLSNVTLSFLPPNTTSHLQPLDQGIIRAFKAVYRRFMLRALLTTMDEADDASALCRSVNVLNAIEWTVKAWKETRTSTIVKCFSTCGFGAAPESSEAEDDDPDDDVPLADLVRQFRFNINDLASLDEHIETEDSDDTWESDLISCYSEQCSRDGSSEEQTPEPAEEDFDETPSLTLKDIHEFAVRLRKFGREADDDFLATAETLIHQSEVKIVKRRCAKKQSVISDFFATK